MKLVVLLAGLAVAAPATVAGQQQSERQADRQPAGLIASDAVTGASVRDRQGEHVGSIDRLIVNHATGEVAHVIVASGGVLGVGRDYVHVAWDDLDFAGDNGEVIARVDRARLDQAPVIERDHFDRMWRGDGTGVTGDRTGVTDAPRADRDRAQAGDTAAPSGTQAGTQAARTDTAIAEHLISSETLHGSQVRDEARRDYGRIERLMIDPDEGEVKYLVIGTGGFLGIGRDHVLVPFENVQIAMVDREVVVTLQEDVLRQAPRNWIGTD